MLLGVSTYAFSWSIGIVGWSPEKPMDGLSFIRRAAELDINLVQIADNLPLDQLSAAEFDSLIGESQRLGMAVEVGTRGIDLDHLRTYLQIALRFQSPILRVVIDTPDYRPPPDEIIERFKRIIPEFEQAGVILAIENHDRFQARTLVEIIESVGSHSLGICLDTANSLGALETTDIIVQTLGAYVVNLHIKDFVIRRANHNLGFVVEGTPSGKGMLKIPELLGRLQAFGRDFNAILELWPPPEASLEATINKESAWVSQSISYLRTLIKE